MLCVAHAERTVITKRRQTQGTGDEGVDFVRTLVGRNNCIFTEIRQEDDLGNDAYIEFVQQQDATGCCIAVQIKSGPSYQANLQGGYSFSSDQDHFEYWAKHALPVGVIFFDPTRGTAVWGDITSHLQQNPQRISAGPYTVTATKPLSADTFDAFRSYWLAYRDRYAGNESFGRALEDFSDIDNLETCTGGLLALFSFQRERPATWHYIISSIRHFRGHPLLPRLIVILAYLPGHGDIFWHSGNIVPESTRRAALPYLRERLGRDDAVAMLEVIDEWGFERGSLGWDVDVVIHRSARREELLESIAFDASLHDNARFSALHLLSYYAQKRSKEDCLALQGRYLAQFPDTDWAEMIEMKQEILRGGEDLP
jgi:hypothetical protein